MRRRLEAIFAIYSTVVFRGYQKFTGSTSLKLQNDVFKDDKIL